MEAQSTSSIEVYNKSIETFVDGAAVVANHVTVAQKAEQVGDMVLSKIREAGGLNPELDKLCNDYIVQANTRLKELTESRKPITQIMDEVKKLFTQEERRLDVKAPGTKAFLIQDERNKYARQKAEEEQRRQEEAARKAAKEKEAAELKAECDRRLSRHFSEAVTAEKNRVQALFNAITLETFEGRKASLLGYTPAYSYEHFTAFHHALVSRLHTPEELEQIIISVTAGRYGDFCTIYTEELGQLKQALIDRLPSKRHELEQLAKADADQKQHLEEERLRREQEEAERLKREEEARLKREEEAIAARKSQDETLALFSDVAEAAPSAAPETRQGYEIVVNHQGAWVLMFQFWFQKEGIKLGLDKFGAKKLESIKTFCETYAHKQGEKIESQYLSYEPTYKAVNRKSTAAA
jgi:Skp family chaperone for outer membrane proteins